jgi:hypothetical protein
MNHEYTDLFHSVKEMLQAQEITSGTFSAVIIIMHFLRGIAHKGKRISDKLKHT